jgi:serine/threonine protein kinase
MIKEMIGKGAFGTVWKAEDNSTHMNVAVKFIDRRYVEIAPPRPLMTIGHLVSRSIANEVLTFPFRKKTQTKR